MQQCNWNGDIVETHGYVQEYWWVHAFKWDNVATVGVFRLQKPSSAEYQLFG